jgi:hypothetical protein
MILTDVVGTARGEEGENEKSVICFFSSANVKSYGKWEMDNVVSKD